MHREIVIHIGDLNKFTEGMNGDKPFIEFAGDDIYMSGFDAEPFVNCEMPANFPMCCEYHKELTNRIFSWYATFPNCCGYHKELSKKGWFARSKFDTVPSKVVKNLYYTGNFIGECINLFSWYEDITNYIEYILESFGSPAIGATLYIIYLEHSLKNISYKGTPIPLKKRRALLKYIKNYTTPSDEVSINLNDLFDVFQKWLNSFPALGLFDNIKKEFNNKLPMNLVIYKRTINPYSKVIKSKIRTNRELVLILTENTKKLLMSVNTSELLLEGKISDKDKYQFGIIGERHKIKQSMLLNTYDQTELGYVDIINRWLKNEQKYLTKIYPLLNNISLNKSNSLEKKEMEDNLKRNDQKVLRVFISYCWEDEINQDHKDWVRFLADLLIKKRIDIVLDQYELKLGSNMIHFMENSVINSDKVIIILSPGFKKKAEGKEGGVGYEHSIITSELYTDQLNSKRKFIPILRMGKRSESVPNFLRQYVGMDMSDDNKFDVKFDELVRDIRDKPKIKKPPLGDEPEFD